METLTPLLYSTLGPFYILFGHLQVILLTLISYYVVRISIPQAATLVDRFQRDDNSYLECALSKKNITHAHNFPVLPTIFQKRHSLCFGKLWAILENCGHG